MKNFVGPFLSENAGIKVVVLFPLQSMASDFEKSVLEDYPGLRISRIDCVTSNENIEKTAGLLMGV